MVQGDLASTMDGMIDSDQNTESVALLRRTTAANPDSTTPSAFVTQQVPRSSIDSSDCELTARVTVDKPFYTPGSLFKASLLLKCIDKTRKSKMIDGIDLDPNSMSSPLPSLTTGLGLPGGGASRATADALMRSSASQANAVLLSPNNNSGTRSPSKKPTSKAGVNIASDILSSPSKKNASLAATGETSIDDSADTSAPSSSMSSQFVNGKGAVIDVIACELVGRWSCDRSWVKSNAHSSYVREARPGSSVSAANIGKSEKQWRDALDDVALGGRENNDGHSGFIFRSNPHVVISRDVLIAGSQLAFQISCMLPESLPPTFRGTAIRYWYSLTFAISVNGGNPHTLRVPFRILHIEHLSYSKDHPEPITIAVPIKHPNVETTRFLPDSDRPEVLDIQSEYVSSVPTDSLEEALAMSLNGRLTAYRTDTQLWKSRNDEEELMSSPFLAGNVGTTSSSESSSSASYLHALGAESYAMGMLGLTSNEIDNEEPGSESRRSPSASPATTMEKALEAEAPSPSPVPPADVAPTDDAIAKKRRNGLSRRVMPVYMIGKESKHVVSIHMSRKYHQLGDTISALFDFSQSTVPCYRISVALEMQEVILPKASRGTKGPSNQAEDEEVIFRRIYGDFDELVLDSTSSNFILSIPPDAPPSFETGAVAVRWNLHVKFITIKNRAVDVSTNHAQPWGRDSKVDTGSLSTKGSSSPTGTVSQYQVESTFMTERPTHGHFDPRKDFEELNWTLPVIVVAGELDAFHTHPIVSLTI